MDKANDDILKRRFGNKTPFAVPDGYFDRLHSDVMAALPEQQQSLTVSGGNSRVLRLTVGIAASVSILVCGAAVWFSSISADKNVALADNDDFIEMLSDADGAAEYLMVDNDDIYAYMSQY